MASLRPDSEQIAPLLIFNPAIYTATCISFMLGHWMWQYRDAQVSLSHCGQGYGSCIVTCRQQAALHRYQRLQFQSEVTHIWQQSQLSQQAFQLPFQSTSQLTKLHFPGKTETSASGIAMNQTSLTHVEYADFYVTLSAKQLDTTVKAPTTCLLQKIFLHTSLHILLHWYLHLCLQCSAL